MKKEFKDYFGIHQNQSVIIIDDIVWDDLGYEHELRITISVNESDIEKAKTALSYALNIWFNNKESEDYCDDLTDQIETIFYDYDITNYLFPQCES